MAKIQLDPERKRIVDRIVKLLALAASTNFEGEAATARELAAQLMAAHQITPGEGAKDRTRFAYEEHTVFAKGSQWEGIIVAALCDLCRCKWLFRPETLDVYTLIGTVADLEVLRYMLAEVNRQRIRAWLNYKADRGPDGFWQFCYGFAKALKSRIDQAVVGPAVRAQQALALEWFEREIHKVKAGHFEWGGRASSEAGLAAGRGASLNRGAVGAAPRLITDRRNR